MRVVDPEHSLAVWCVQRQRIGDTLRPRHIWRHAAHLDLHPETAAHLGKKAVELQQALETFVLSGHMMKISVYDNKRKLPCVLASA
jgi:hypothetical protein